MIEFIGIIVVLVLLYFMYKGFKKHKDDNIFVYRKTGNKYRFICHGKLKNPDTRVWVDAVFYESLDDHATYAKEYNDFINNFVNIRDYKND